jgi:hypothetical protein
VSEPPPPTRRRRIDPGLVAVILMVVVFVAHRLLVALSAGDFLYPLEPSEAKNTQIAWDLMTGRLGTVGFTPSSYISNSGSIHHGSYSTAALSYLFVSRFTGYGLLSIRLVPLLFNAVALGVWMEILRRSIGLTAALLAGLALLLVPTLFIAFDLTFLGCHPESQLPLALTIGAWLLWLRDDLLVPAVAAARADGAAGPDAPARTPRQARVRLGGGGSVGRALAALVDPGPGRTRRAVRVGDHRA